MERKLRTLFEYQSFAGNSRLDRMMDEAEQRYGVALEDEDLSLVSAAGTEIPLNPPANGIEDHPFFPR